jgi:oxygen-independent coproporphyrinogen-3 oxidase
MPQLTQLTSISPAYQELAHEIKENSRTVDAYLTPDDARSAASVYMHVPFCVHKCHYCDFYSIVDSRDRQAAFTARLIRELRASQSMFSVPVCTIFVGGGTPTLLAPSLWRELGDTIHKCITLAPDGEFTVEANPETVTPELADVLVAAGVNRVSIGAQSFDPRHLKMLERQHDPGNVERSMAIFRAAGVDNINVDLIFAIPGQTLGDWQRDLERVIELEPAHMSCYGLTYEPNTAMTQRLKAGQFERADESLEAEMYELTMDRLAAAGFRHYEISNWSLPGPDAGMQCQHNLAYWTNANWWALGPSASGHMSGLRWKNVPRLGEYLDSDSSDGLPPVIDVERVDEDSRAGEELMLRLRLLDGVPSARLSQLLSDTPRGEARRSAINRYVDAGLLESDERAVRFTRRGLLLADSVLADLV